MRALAVTTAKRSIALPDIPTIAEAALPGYDTGLWYGLFAQKATPRETVMALNAQIRQVLGTREVRDSIGKQGAEAAASSPADLQALVLAEIDKWHKLIMSMGLNLEQ